VIRERRKKQADLQAEEKQKKDEAEAEMGRKLEEDKSRELARWEAVYGDPGKRQSTAAETSILDNDQRCSTVIEVVEAPGDTVENEMNSLCKSGRGSITVDEEEKKQDTTDSSDMMNVDSQLTERPEQSSASQEMSEFLG
jgi:hypothetical protein